MNDMHDNDLVRWLEQLGDVKPAAEATRRAVERARHALVAAPPVTLAATSKLSTTSIAVTASVLLVAAGLTGWLLLSPGDGPQSGLKTNAPASVCYRQTTRSAGESAVTIRLQIRADGAWRADKSDGSYTVVDPAKQLALFVNQSKHEAVLRHDASGPQLTLYEAVKDLPNDPSARPLPARKLDGQDVIGYVAKSQGQDVIIWVDAQTSLLVRVECDWKSNDGKLANVVLDQFEFGKELDNALFSMEPPAGFKVNGAAVAVPAPPEQKANDLVVTPLVGLGPVKFGMSRADVEAAFGKAESFQETKDGYIYLNYTSQGFGITVSTKSGVVGIACRAAAHANDPSARDFGGKTDKGIALGASMADIVAAYGPAHTKREAEEVTMAYVQPHIYFTLIDDKLIKIRITSD